MEPAQAAMKFFMVIVTISAFGNGWRAVPFDDIEECRKDAITHIGVNEERTIIRTTICLHRHEFMDFVANYNLVRKDGTR